jgi:hypothetical protein
MQLPLSYRSAGEILTLNKASFGLRKSSLLQQKELNKALRDRELGSNP